MVGIVLSIKDTKAAREPPVRTAPLGGIARGREGWSAAIKERILSTGSTDTRRRCEVRRDPLAGVAKLGSRLSRCLLNSRVRFRVSGLVAQRGLAGRRWEGTQPYDRKVKQLARGGQRSCLVL